MLVLHSWRCRRHWYVPRGRGRGCVPRRHCVCVLRRAVALAARPGTAQGEGPGNPTGFSKANLTPALTFSQCQSSFEGRACPLGLPKHAIADTARGTGGALEACPGINEGLISSRMGKQGMCRDVGECVVQVTPNSFGRWSFCAAGKWMYQRWC
jgi:hypothetical protein